MTKKKSLINRVRLAAPLLSLPVNGRLMVVLLL